MAALGTTTDGAHRNGVGLRYDLDRPFELPQALFIDEVARRALSYARYIHIPTKDDAAKVIAEFGSVRFHQESLITRRWVVELGAGALALVSAESDSVDIHVAADSHPRVREASDALTAAFTPKEEVPDTVVVAYWSWSGEGMCGGTLRPRRIRVPVWAEIEANHAADTRQALHELMPCERPHAGRLILWHGPPGTGKTFALRALARSWRDWCAPHFITDPEKLLSESCYLVNALTSGDPDSDRDREWRLLILEDSGELLSADARERTGQALSRLLNLTDGLLGQTMNAIVLVTTNEPLRKLHPAVARTGRCLAEVEFEPLSVAEANAWLAERDSSLSVTAPKTISELYGLIDGRASPAEEHPIGFAAASAGH